MLPIRRPGLAFSSCIRYNSCTFFILYEVAYEPAEIYRGPRLLPAAVVDHDSHAGAESDHQFCEPAGQSDGGSGGHGAHVRRRHCEPAALCAEPVPLRRPCRRWHLHRPVLRQGGRGRHSQHRAGEAVVRADRRRPGSRGVPGLWGETDLPLPPRGGGGAGSGSDSPLREGLPGGDAGADRPLRHDPGLFQHPAGDRGDRRAHARGHRRSAGESGLQLYPHLRQAGSPRPGRGGRGHGHGALPLCGVRHRHALDPPASATRPLYPRSVSQPAGPGGAFEADPGAGDAAALK